MLEAADFVKEALKENYKFYAGVPCSFLTPFIDHVIDNKDVTYVGATNEGDAVAIAAGASIGGFRSVAMMQNSGLGNAVSPLTSLTHTFRLPVLIICTLRGEPELNDEPQHELMGRITSNLLDQMKIPWEFFPSDKNNINGTLTRAENHFERYSTPYALIMKKGACNSTKKNTNRTNIRTRSTTTVKASKEAKLLSRFEILKKIVVKSQNYNAVILATTGYAGRELYKVGDKNNQFYMVGSMGCISSLGLGLALARPDLRVILIDGDGAALMRLGNLATMGAYSPNNIFHFLLDNEVHQSTGGQSTVSNSIDFAEIAAACGYKNATRLARIEEITESLFELKEGPNFYHCKTNQWHEGSLPRPKISPADLTKRLKEHIS